MLLLRQAPTHLSILEFDSEERGGVDGDSTRRGVDEFHACAANGGDGGTLTDSLQEIRRYKAERVSFTSHFTASNSCTHDAQLIKSVRLLVLSEESQVLSVISSKENNDAGRATSNP